MNITPEMARAELARRRGQSPRTSNFSITPEMARAELERRRSLNSGNETSEPSVKRSLVRGTKNALGSFTDVLDLVASPVRGAINTIAPLVGSERQIPTLGNQLDVATDKHYKPTNSEKVQDEVLRSVGTLPIGNVAGAGLGAVKNASKLIQPSITALGNFLKGSNTLNKTNVAATGATSGVVQNSLNENPEDTVGALGKGLGTGVGVAAVPGILGMLTSKGRLNAAGTLGKRLGVNSESVKAFNESGISPTLADVSDNARIKMYSSKLEKLPFVGGKLQTTRDLQKHQILEGLGQSENRDLLNRGRGSELTIKGAKEFQKDNQSVHRKMFSKLEEDIEGLPDSSIGIESVNEFFEPIFKKFKTSSQEKRFKNSKLGKMYVDLYETANQNGGKLPYYDVKDRLDEINDLITTHGEIGKVSQGKFKGFAGALSKDIEKSLSPRFEKMGGESLENWVNTKELYKEYAQESIPNLNELYKKDKKGATDAFLDLLRNQKKGAEKTKLVMEGLNEKDQVDLLDNITKELGRSTDGTFSPLKWVREFKSLEPTSQNALLTPLNDSARKKVFAIADSVDQMKATLNEANTSKTAYYTALGTVANMAGNAATNLLSLNPIPAAKLAAGLFLGKITSEKLLTNPKFINWLDKGLQAKNMNQFERILNNVPSVGKYKKALLRETQMFQHDLSNARKEGKDNNP